MHAVKVAGCESSNTGSSGGDSGFWRMGCNREAESLELCGISIGSLLAQVWAPRAPSRTEPALVNTSPGGIWVQATKPFTKKYQLYYVSEPNPVGLT